MALFFWVGPATHWVDLAHSHPDFLERQIKFSCKFGHEEMFLRAQLLGEIDGISPTNAIDNVYLSLELSSMFSTNSMYRKLNQRATVAPADDIWSLPISLKVRIFL
jgi:hypothetical protein